MHQSITPWQPQIFAHRGGAGSWPQFIENSKEAFAAASAAGFTSECDVWPSSDGVPVVIHDETLDRTTSLRGKVADYHSDELRRANVPMLPEVSHFVSLVEIKPANARRFVRSVIDIMRNRKWTLMAFDEANLKHALEYDSSVHVAFLVKDAEAVDIAIAGKWPTNMDHRLLDVRKMAQLRGAGLSVGCWTVDAKSDFDRIAPLRPELIISNVPEMIREILRTGSV